MKNKLSIFCLIIIILSPIITQGIVCNDELRTRFFAQQGFIEIWNYCLTGFIAQGRVLAVPLIAISGFIGFASQNIIINGCIKIILILINVSLFSLLIYRIKKEKYFSMFVAISLLIFLPISFEHTMPEAFVSMFGLSFSSLLGSMILFYMYLEKSKKEYLIISLVLLFISLTGYELFIMYTPMYLFLILFKSDKSKLSIKYILNKLKYHIIISIIYLIIYYIIGKTFPTSYEGNQLAKFDLIKMLQIIYIIIKSAIPGYYLFSDKYQYIFNSFNGFEEYTLEQLFDIRVVIFIILLSVTLFRIFKSCFNNKEVVSKRNSKKNIYTVLIAILFCILPTIPNSLALSWHVYPMDNIDGIATTTTYFVYFSVVFIVCYILWELLKIIKPRFMNQIMCIVIICIIILSTPIQIMNNIFSNEQNKSFNRLVMIEKLFDTKIIKDLNNKKVYSKDLYERKNLLAINNNYWTQYAKSKGLEIEFSQDFENQDVLLNYVNDAYFEISYKDTIIILSPKSLQGISIPIYKNNEFCNLNLTNSIKDNKFYMYVINTDQSIKQVSSNFEFNNLFPTGNTLLTAKKIFGYYSDGWIEKSSEFEIQTNNMGKLQINGYYPGEISSNLTGIIYVNEKATKFLIEKNDFVITLDAPKDQEIAVRIECDFDRQASDVDLRRIAFILKDLEGK